MHKLRHTYIGLHTMTWSWRDLDQATHGDMWQSLQPMRRAQVCVFQLTWLTFTLRFRNDKMDHCHISWIMRLATKLGQTTVEQLFVLAFT